MQVERASAGASLIDVLDRVLDKGIVIDAWVRLSLIGIDLITVEARVVVASIETYLHHSEALGAARTAARPEPHRPPASLAESLGTPQKSGSPHPVPLPPAFRDRTARQRSPHSA